MADIKVRVGQKNAIKVTSSLSGASAGSLGELSDVNVTNPQNGMVLVYNSTTQQWTGTCLLYTSPSPRDSDTSRMPSSA